MRDDVVRCEGCAGRARASSSHPPLHPTSTHPPTPKTTTPTAGETARAADGCQLPVPQVREAAAHLSRHLEEVSEQSRRAKMNEPTRVVATVGRSRLPVWGKGLTVELHTYRQRVKTCKDKADLETTGIFLVACVSRGTASW